MKLKAGEVIERIIRKHPLYFVLESFGLLILAFLPIWLPTTLGKIFSLAIEGESMALPSLSTLTFDENLLSFWFLLWMLGWWLIFTTRLTNFFLDKWILTNKRLIDIDQKGFFSREISSLRYRDIQDVTVEINGILATVVDFGTIHVQTAGAQQEFTLMLAPKPLKNKEIIIKKKINNQPPKDRL